VLLTRSPLGLRQCCHWVDLVRLACVKHAASVRPEPGSNSPSKTRTPSQAMMAFDRAASRRAESLDCEALAPSDGANTIRILTVRFVIHDRIEAEAPRRSPALALSSCLLFSRSGLRSRHVPSTGRWCRFQAPILARIGRAGRRDNLTAAPVAVNLRPVFREDFLQTGRDLGFRPRSSGSNSLRHAARDATRCRISPRDPAAHDHRPSRTSSA
jgi:hypothetical protein